MVAAGLCAGVPCIVCWYAIAVLVCRVLVYSVPVCHVLCAGVPVLVCCVLMCHVLVYSVLVCQCHVCRR